MNKPNMIDLQWNYGYNRVLNFNDRVHYKDIDRKGLFMVASKHGKVTNLCYGNILKIYKRFERIYNSSNLRNIECYTYAFYDNDENSQNVLLKLQKSLFYNKDFETVRKQVKLPEYILFTDLKRSYCFNQQTKSDAWYIFNQFAIIATDYNLLDKLECIVTKQNNRNNFEIFIITTSYYDSEFDIISKFGNNYYLKDYEEQDNTILEAFGYINDWPPNC